MTASRVVARENCRYWKTKTNRNRKEIFHPGSVNPWLVVAVCFVFAAFYLYFINNSATKGSEIRAVEEKIEELKKENEQLRIKEAELKSLYNIEHSSREMNMSDLVKVSFIEEKSPVAVK